MAGNDDWADWRGCVCGGGAYGQMVACDGGCDNWFHLDCVGLAPRSFALRGEYICDACGAAAGATKIICLDIRKGHKGYVVPTPELIAASRNAPVFAKGVFGLRLDACACRGKGACGLVASGAIDVATGCISITPNPEMQFRMLGILPADIDQPTHTWAEADVSVSIWSLAMQNKLSAGSKGFLQFEDLFSERLVISRCGSLQSATCDALDRFADAAVLRAVADQRRLKVQVVATLSGTAFCLTSVNGVTVRETSS